MEYILSTEKNDVALKPLYPFYLQVENNTQNNTLQYNNTKNTHKITQKT